MTRKNIRLHNRINDLQDAIQRLLITVRVVRQRRAMNAAEPPELQDAWDRLTLAVLEADWVLLGKPLDKKHK